MEMIDDLTPYYQSRMSELPPQQRKIVEYLCSCKKAILVKEIAQYCFLSNQAASSQLKLLRERGYVEATTLGREAFYELGEPLMRICIEVKKHRGEPIRMLVGFLRLWYSKEEIVQKLGSLQNSSSLESMLESCEKSIETGNNSSQVFYNRAIALLALNHRKSGQDTIQSLNF